MEYDRDQTRLHTGSSKKIPRDKGDYQQNRRFLGPQKTGKIEENRRRNILFSKAYTQRNSGEHHRMFGGRCKTDGRIHLEDGSAAGGCPAITNSEYHPLSIGRGHNGNFRRRQGSRDATEAIYHFSNDESIDYRIHRVTIQRGAQECVHQTIREGNRRGDESSGLRNEVLEARISLPHGTERSATGGVGINIGSHWRQHANAIPRLGHSIEVAVCITGECDFLSLATPTELAGKAKRSLLMKNRRQKRWNTWCKEAQAIEEKERLRELPLKELYTYHVKAVEARRIPPHYGEQLFRFLSDPVMFAKRLRRRPSKWPESSLPQACIELAERNGLISETFARETAGISLASLVCEESKRRYRLVVDTLEENVRCDRHVENSMKEITFRTIGSLKASLRRASFGAVLDMTQFFHQFPLHEDIRKYFSFHCNDRMYCMNRMPMGWTLAPAIAQTFLCKVAKECGIRDEEVDIYIDNVFIFGNEARVRILLDRLLRKLREYNVTVGEVNAGVEVTHRGATWNIQQKTVQLKQSFVEKLRATVTSDRVPCSRTWGQWRTFISRLIYATTVLEIPRSTLWNTIRWAASMEQQHIDTTIQSPREVQHEIKQIMPLTKSAITYASRPYGGIVFTDASDKGLGYIWFDTSTTHSVSNKISVQAEAARYTQTMFSEHISKKEFAAMLYAVTNLENDKVYDIYVDNTTVFWALKNKYSPTETVNKMILTLGQLLATKGISLRPHFVRSQYNKADVYSRMLTT